MSILSGFEKVKDRILTSTGYKLRSLWTSSQTVELDDGTVLQDKIESMDTEIDGKAPLTHTHTAAQVTGLTASRAMVSDGSGHPAVSAVTSTELGYLDGATGNIQDQIDTLNSNLDNLIKTQSFAGYVNLPSKGEGNVDMGRLNIPTGYTYIGVISKDSDYGDQFLCSFQRYGDHIYVVVRNTFAGTLTGDVSCTALFLKN